MKKSTKKTIIAWSLAVLYGIIVTIVFRLFNAEPEYMLYAFVSVGVIGIIYTMQNKQYRKFLNELKSINSLFEQKKFEEYIEKNTALLEMNDSNQAEAIVNLNITEAYLKMNEFDKAKETLEKLNPKKIHGQLKTFYYAKETYYYFCKNEYKKALENMELHSSRFAKMLKSETFGAHVALLYAFDFIANKDKKKASDILDDMKEHTKGLEEEIAVLEKVIRS